MRFAVASLALLLLAAAPAVKPGISVTCAGSWELSLDRTVASCADGCAIQKGVRICAFPLEQYPVEDAGTKPPAAHADGGTAKR